MDLELLYPGELLLFLCLLGVHFWMHTFLHSALKKGLYTLIPVFQF